MNPQLEAQTRACASGPRHGHPLRIAHVDGRVTNHRTLFNALRSCRFGDVVYLWYEGRWAIWTSAGLI